MTLATLEEKLQGLARRNGQLEMEACLLPLLRQAAKEHWPTMQLIIAIEAVFATLRDARSE